MASLARGDEVLGPVEVLATRRARGRGLIGRHGVDGVVLLEPCRSVHTFGMRFTIDVLFCRRTGDALTVVRAVTMKRRRVSRPVPGSGVVLEAEAGWAEGWRVAPGDVLRVVA